MIFDLLKDYCHRNIVLTFVVVFVLGFLGSFLFFTLRKTKNTSVAVTTDMITPSNSEIVVDLAGAVVTPGIYSLPATSRVGDLIVKGGGILDAASILWVSKNVNLSQKLIDSQKIYIPFEWEFYTSLDQNVEVAPLYYKKISTVKESSSVVSSSGDINTSTLINVNNASSQELDALVGIGPTYAQRIIDNRPYVDFVEFLSKSTLSASVCEKLKDSISF